MVLLILVLVSSIFTIGCQTDILTPQKPSSGVLEELSLIQGVNQDQLQITLQRLQGEFRDRGIEDTKFTYYYWAIHILDSLGLSVESMNVWDLDSITRLLFQDHPDGHFAGPYQQITLSTSDGQVFVLQSSYFTLPAGTGTMMPSPYGLLQLLEPNSGAWFQFLFFVDRPAMPVDWWVELDQPLESSVQEYRASVHGQVMDGPFAEPKVDLMQQILQGSRSDQHREMELHLSSPNRKTYQVLWNVYEWYLHRHNED
jgi:hypothetical protein